MSKRNTTIALTDDEKDRLDAAAETLCGTTEVPYGFVASTLAAERIADDKTDTAETSPTA